MSVTNRKMFRSRNARNKLNQMGGIMASSPELMGTVQKFSNGMSVRVPNTQQEINRRNVATMGPGITSIQDFINKANAQSGIANMPTTPQGAFRSPRVEGPTGTQVLMDRTGQALQDIFGVPENAPIRDPAGMYREAFGETPERTQARVDFASGVRDFINDPLAAFRENPVDALMSQPETMRGPRAEDIPTDVTQRLKRRGSPVDIAETEKLAEELFGGELKTTVDKKTSGTTKKADALADLPSTVDPKKIESDPEAATDFGSKIVAIASQFLSSNANETEKNDLLLELTGRKDPESKLTMKERYKENLELYREVFGESPEQDKKIDGYNLAMLGFLIASGDSPNALQNIAKGAAAGVDRIQKTAEARQAREEKLKFAALQRASSQQDAEIERQTRWAQTLYKDSRDAKRAQDQMAFDLAKLNIELEEKRELANDKAASDQARADANNRANQLRTMINNYGELGNLAATQLMTEGFDPESIFTQEGFEKLTDTMEDLAKRFPQISATSQKSKDPGMTLEAFVRDRQREFDNNVDYQDLMSDRLGKPVSEITPEDIENYATRQYGMEQSASSASSASPALAYASEPVQIANREEYDALPSGASYIDPKGNPGVKR